MFNLFSLQPVKTVDFDALHKDFTSKLHTLLSYNVYLGESNIRDKCQVKPPEDGWLWVQQ